MLLRGSLIVIALTVVVLAACSGPDPATIEGSTATPVAAEPTATSAASVAPSPASSATPTATPSPTPTLAPSPTPVPVCDEDEVAALVNAFVASFNGGDWERLSRLLPARADGSAPVTPTAGVDTTRFLGSWITTEVRGADPMLLASADQADLISHLQARHALGERWDATIADISPFGSDDGWDSTDAAQVMVDIARSANDLTERPAEALAVLDCRAGTIAFWEMADDPLPPVEIVSFSLNDIDGEPLRFLSADEHPYFEGYTLINGTLQVAGDGELAEVVLEVIEDGAVVATGELSDSARDLLIGPFDGGVREVAEVQPLFRIDSSQFQAVNRDKDGVLTLRVRVTTTNGDEAIVEYATPVAKLVLYRGENRYLLDEEDRGGNDWVQPSVRDIIAGWEDVQLGDFSDMNGGPYPPHVSHQRGLDVDVWFFGYNELDEYAAETILSYIDGKEYTSRIDVVFVAYQPIVGDPFWDAIAGHILSDGRHALSVIVADEGHSGHFHVRFASRIQE